MLSRLTAPFKPGHATEPTQPPAGIKRPDGIGAIADGAIESANDAHGGSMAIRLTVEVDEERLRGAGQDAGEGAILAQLDTLKDGRVSLQTRDAWLPVRLLTVRQRLEPVAALPSASAASASRRAAAGAPGSHRAADCTSDPRSEHTGSGPQGARLSPRRTGSPTSRCRPGQGPTDGASGTRPDSPASPAAAPPCATVAWELPGGCSA